MVELPVASDRLPAWSEVSGLHIASLRHLQGDDSVAPCVAALGLAWPVAPGELSGCAPYLAWRSPRESLFLSMDREPLSALLKALAPGQSETALAIELSEALAVYELRGPTIDLWLSHLVASMSVPSEFGRANCARMADIPVTLLRLHPERLWLLADRPTKLYVKNWLTYSHEGVFCDGAGATAMPASHAQRFSPL